VIIHTSGEKSKRGEILFPKRGIAIFITVEFRARKMPQPRVRAKDMKCQGVMIAWVGKMSGRRGVENVAEMKF
jgi:hypothetical protein